MSEIERLQLLSDQTRDRRLLLAAAQDLTDADLTRPTRNSGWTVAHVLAHVLAADQGLTGLLQAADELAPHTKRVDSVTRE